MVRERGSGETPTRVVEELKKAVAATSQLEVSKKTGIGQAAINRYLKGIGEPTTATLEKISILTGISVAELRGEKRFGLHDLLKYVTEIQQEFEKMPHEGYEDRIVKTRAALEEGKVDTGQLNREIGEHLENIKTDILIKVQERLPELTIENFDIAFSLVTQVLKGAQPLFAVQEVEGRKILAVSYGSSNS